ncbi:hypothetical protein [Sphingobium subterraneum]|uniref:Secreted protein n=1 Tax=Sphingobium subterraneum TaxID=627688 RepID=A0A841J2U1_9SPHN|nr:hypothetical protein [Sphingobium subterraneum]MBB6123846.1 hypothetical protein [Sphingobium subterraneum]
MPLARSVLRPSIALAVSLVALSLSGCGDKGSGTSGTVKMKDMDVVDGTINDAMTDLDGVQSEAVAIADSGNATGPASNSSVPAPKPQDAAVGNSAETVAEQ